MPAIFFDIRLISLQSESFSPQNGKKTSVCEKIIIDVIIQYIIAGDRKMAHKIGILQIKSEGLAPLTW